MYPILLQFGSFQISTYGFMLMMAFIINNYLLKKYLISINQNAKIDLSIYNLNGQLVEVILNDFVYPGTYSIKWDASNYSTGMYLLVATNGNYSETKKLMLVK